MAQAVPHTGRRLAKLPGVNPQARLLPHNYSPNYAATTRPPHHVRLNFPLDSRPCIDLAAMSSRVNTVSDPLGRLLLPDTLRRSGTSDFGLIYLLYSVMGFRGSRRGMPTIASLPI